MKSIGVLHLKSGVLACVNSGGAHIKPLLKKWWGTMLSNYQKVVEHLPLGPNYGDTREMDFQQIFIHAH